jgi:hypothetical protein
MWCLSTLIPLQMSVLRCRVLVYSLATSHDVYTFLWAPSPETVPHRRLFIDIGLPEVHTHWRF